MGPHQFQEILERASLSDVSCKGCFMSKKQRCSWDFVVKGDRDRDGVGRYLPLHCKASFMQGIGGVPATTCRHASAIMCACGGATDLARLTALILLSYLQCTFCSVHSSHYMLLRELTVASCMCRVWKVGNQQQSGGIVHVNLWDR
jgi:hypothetical protein